MYTYMCKPIKYLEISAFALSNANFKPNANHFLQIIHNACESV